MSPVDNRNASGTLATKENIIPQDGNPAAHGDPSKAGDLYTEGVDASVGASGPLAAGTYAVLVSCEHPGVAAAGRQVLVERRDAANTTTVATLLTANAGAGRRRLSQLLTLVASERIRAISGTDVTNTNVSIRLVVKRVDL